MSKKKIIGGVCAALAVVVVGGYVITSQKGAAQMIVSTETLQQMDLKNTISLTGTVETQTGRKVYSTLTYPVESVNVEVGDVVQEGDLLAKLKTDDLELDIAQQQAAVNASNNQAAHQIEVNRKAYENAKENYENDLNANALSAEQGVTQAEYGVEQAKQQVESAEAAVRDAKENYRLTRDQLNGNVDTARKALDKAEEALADAKSAYNSAVAGMEGQIAAAEAQAKAEYAKLEEQYGDAIAEWAHLDETYRQDIKDANEKLDTAKNEMDKKYPDWEKLLEEGNTSSFEGSQEYKDYLSAKEELEHAKWVHLTEKEKYQAIESTLNQAKANIESAKANAQAAAQSGVSAAQSGVASAEGGVASAEAQLDAAKDARDGATLAQVEQGIGTARRGVESAELSEELAKVQAESAKQQEEAAKVAIEQQIDSLQDSLIGSQLAAESNRAQEIAIQKMQNTLDDASITAPVSGVVTAVYAKVGEPGNGLLFVVEDTESLKITTRIKEYDIANVQVGMPVTIKSDATGDKEISGTITYIAPAAVKSDTGSTQTSSNNSNVEFEAEVQVNDKDSGLRIGMNTRLTVLLEEKENVFGVPYDSVVKKQDGTDVLYTLQPKDDKSDSYVVTELPVTTGLETDFYVEVSGSGIKEGMSIVSDPQSVTPGIEVTPDFAAAGTTPVVGLS